MGEEVEIDCGVVLSIADLGDFYATLLMVVAEGNCIKFNVSKIERIDGAALQLIYSYAKDALKNGHALTWNQPSEAFIRSARLLGLLAVMNLEEHVVDVSR